MGAVIGLIYVAILVAVVVAQWKVFTKAGKPGWACLIPIYNIIVMLEIIGKPTTWFIFFLIPLLNIYYAWLFSQEMAKVFGKSSSFGISLFFLMPIFVCILGYGSATYTPPAAAPGSPAVAA